MRTALAALAALFLSATVADATPFTVSLHYDAASLGFSGDFAVTADTAAVSQGTPSELTVSGPTVLYPYSTFYSYSGPSAFPPDSLGFVMNFALPTGVAGLDAVAVVIEHASQNPIVGQLSAYYVDASHNRDLADLYEATATLTPRAVPEPGTAALMLLASLGTVTLLRRR